MRVVGSGLSRTGTRSVYAALLRQGVSAVHYPFDERTQQVVARGEFPEHLGVEVVLDLSTAAYFDRIAESQSDVMIVHTTRQRESWLPAVRSHYDGLIAEWDSYSKRFKDFGAFITEAAYGAFPPSDEDFARAFDEQEQKVERWLHHFPDRVLVLDVFTGAGYADLGPFLKRQPFGGSEFPCISDAEEAPIAAAGAERTVLFEESTPSDRQDN